MRCCNAVRNDVTRDTVTLLQTTFVTHAVTPLETTFVTSVPYPYPVTTPRYRSFVVV